MDCNKLSALVISVLALSSKALAAEYSCSAKDNAYAHSVNAAAGNLSEQIEIVKSWIPPKFKVNGQTIDFERKKAFAVTGGDRNITFEGFRRGSGSSSSQYKIKIDPFESSGVVYRYRSGYVPMGPVFFNCYKLSSANEPSGRIKGNLEQNEFRKLSSCNRKYVQQFLKGQGFYTSSIDGKWGPGTAAAVKRAMTMPKFRNLTIPQFFDKLKNNPIC